MLVTVLATLPKGLRPSLTAPHWHYQVPTRAKNWATHSGLKLFVEAIPARSKTVNLAKSRTPGQNSLEVRCGWSSHPMGLNPFQLPTIAAGFLTNHTKQVVRAQLGFPILHHIEGRIRNFRLASVICNDPAPTPHTWTASLRWLWASQPALSATTQFSIPILPLKVLLGMKSNLKLLLWICYFDPCLDMIHFLFRRGRAPWIFKNSYALTVAVGS